MNDPTLEELIKEAKREMGMRYAVYSKKVQSGTMTEDQKAHLIRLQGAIVLALERLKRIDELGELV